jgi:hypothetical protein
MKNLLTLILLLIFSISYADDIKIITKEIKDSSVQLRYHTSASYPQLDGMKDENIQKKINKEIYNTMIKGVNNFKKDMAEWDLENIPKDFSSEMEYTYSTYTLNDDVFSFAFEVYSYYAGAAHPNHWTVSMNFDLKKGKLISIKDLFKPGTKYLTKVSSYCIADLKMQAGQDGYGFDEEMLISGAGPKDSNFMNFNILQKGLQITFDPYQVAPYVAGAQYVMIPFKVFYEILEPEGVLSKFDF